MRALNEPKEENSPKEDDEDMRKLVLLDEDSILETNSVSYPTLKNMLGWDYSDNLDIEGEAEKVSFRSEKVKSKS